jgi:hypothetical protein
VRRAALGARPSLRRRELLRLLAGSAVALAAGCNDGAPDVTAPAVSSSAKTLFGSQVYPSDDVARSTGMLAGIGAKYVRVAVQVPQPFLDALVGAAVRHGLRPILVSGYAAQPVDAAVYAAAVAALHVRYAFADPVWEIWNEPNLPQYWNGTPNVAAYLTLFDATAQALRAVGATDIWTGGTSGVDLNWIYNLVTGGAFRTATGCAVHSYKPPGYARTEYIQAASFLPSGVGLHTTETCIASSVGSQAQFFQQMWYLHRELGLPTMIWCEFRDGGAGSEPPFNEPYGLVQANYQIKSVFAAAQVAISSNT